MSTQPPIVVGIDFDNTLVCYDTLFHRVAAEQKLIPDDVPVNKTAVRNYLRQIGREPAWTEMQGVVYGNRIVEAEAYPGALDFIRQGIASGWTLHIVSHKTRYPIKGEPVDLHESARRWLETQGVHSSAIGLPRGNVWFAPTKTEKAQRAEALGCQVFIDDLPEFLLDPAFPSGIRRILFDPQKNVRPSEHYTIVHSWAEIPALVSA
ncbi:hypothetical protein DB346_04455 [Verrucomicrobia bacterium LW23]|nr:hypothetical protein DB346_04455 [Verrucomicrobia bacterium LW23]